MTPQEKLSQQIQLLESLAVIDAAIKRLDAQIAEQTGSLSGLRKELAFLDNKLSSDKASSEEMQKTLSEQSAEVRQMTAQVEKSREKLGRTRNERENVAVEREIEELRKLLRDREEEVGKLKALVDTAKKSIEESVSRREKVFNELNSIESGTSSQLIEVSKEREDKIAERTELAKKVPPPTMRRYDNTLKKRGSGITRVVSGTCMACHIGLPPQQFQRLLRREQFEECPNCHRLLYWIPDTPPAEEQA